MRNRNRFHTRLRAGTANLGRKIANLFAAGQAGAWYDYGLLTQEYQDSAGTTPVTAVEQPLGKVNDLSGRNNHLTQATAASRPLVSARVNWLTDTEGLIASYPVRNSVIQAVSSITGFTNSVHFNASGIDSWAYKTSTLTAGVSYVLSVYIQMDDGLAPVPGSNNGASDFGLVVDGGLTGSGYTTTQISSGLYRVTTTFTTSGAAGANYGILKYLANTARTFKTTGYQLTYGSVATAYQQVTNSTTYNTSGFPAYSVFDGVDDSLTSATGGGATTGFFWCGAVKPLGGAGAVRTIFSDVGANTGYKVQLDTANKLSFSAGNGAAYTTIASTATVDVGVNNLITAWDDGTNLNVQINNATAQTVARPTVTAGTTSFTVGKDNGAATSFVNGNLYPEIYRTGTPLTAAEIAAAQAWCKAKAGI